MSAHIGHRGGATFNAARDGERLDNQHAEVWELMRDGEWRCLRDISLLTGHPEASISARLRDFRKDRYGAHVVDRRHVQGGLWEYRVTPAVRL